MLDNIAQWIEHTNLEFKAQRHSCLQFADAFAGSYSREFLQNAHFVVVDTLPMPNFPEIREMGLGDFLDGDYQGMTYNDTYYIKRGWEDTLSLHFHELVHVAQWQLLGVKGFISRYMTELQAHGYDDAPLEQMADGLERRFRRGLPPVDVSSLVKQILA